MRDPEAAAAKLAEAEQPVHVPLSRDTRALNARIRAECHQLVKFLATHAWDDAASVTHDPEALWTPSAIESEGMAYEERQGGPPDATPRARRPHLTLIEPDGKLRWRIRHTLLDAEGEIAGYLEGVVDLSEDQDPVGPVLQLERLAD